MYQRHLTPELLEMAKDYPIVTVLGPRQSGKTTLARYAFPGKPYFNLESPDTRKQAIDDPRAFLADLPEGAILDEIQRAPELLSYLQVIVDELKTKGLFILTGSQHLAVHEAISQSLAGRTAILRLLPMSIAEMGDAELSLNLDHLLLHGGYPRVYADNLNPTKAYRDYVQTYVERDVREISRIKDLMQFQRFMRLCAGRTGQLLNLESLGNDLGVTGHTIRHWISILEASFVIFRLEPYFENFGKRVIKAPKLYFTDVGLASYLLGLENVGQVKRDPLRGHLVENLVILELMKARLNQGLDPHLYFFCDVKGNEVDAVYQRGHELIPIEIKAAQTYNSSLLKGLVKFRKLVGDRAPTGYLIYAGESEGTVQEMQMLNYRHASHIV